MSNNKHLEHEARIILLNNYPYLKAISKVFKTLDTETMPRMVLATILHMEKDHIENVCNIISTLNSVPDVKISTELQELVATAPVNVQSICFDTTLTPEKLSSITESVKMLIACVEKYFERIRKSLPNFETVSIPSRILKENLYIHSEICGIKSFKDQEKLGLSRTLTLGKNNQFWVRGIDYGDQCGVKDTLVHNDIFPMIEIFSTQGLKDQDFPHGRLLASFFVHTILKHIEENGYTRLFLSSREESFTEEDTERLHTWLLYGKV